MSNSEVSFDGKDIKTLDFKLFFPFFHGFDSKNFLFRKIEFHNTNRFHCSIKLRFEVNTGKIIISPVMNEDSVWWLKVDFKAGIGVEALKISDCLKIGRTEMNNFGLLQLIHKCLIFIVTYLGLQINTFTLQSPFRFI